MGFSRTRFGCYVAAIKVSMGCIAESIVAIVHVDILRGVNKYKLT